VAGIEQEYENWWENWHRNNYSWGGLAKIEWVGWVYVENKTEYEAWVKKNNLPEGCPSKLCQVIPVSRSKELRKNSKIRKATLQDYWRDQEKRLFTDTDGITKWAAPHLPFVFFDGSKSWKTDRKSKEWPELYKLMQTRASKGSYSEIQLTKNKIKILECDSRSQFQGVVLSNFKPDLLTAQNLQFHVNFENSFFSENSDFQSINFASSPNFQGSMFHGDRVSFENCLFQKDGANFKKCIFGTQKTTFKNAIVREGLCILFSNSRFLSSHSDFTNFEVNTGFVDFSRTEFRYGGVSFANAKFAGGNVVFSGAIFCKGRANFNAAKFIGGPATFSGTKFLGSVTSFENSTFSAGPAKFKSAIFNGIHVSFKNTKFLGGRTLFSKSSFKAENVSFRNAKFEVNSVSFLGAKFECQQIRFDGALFKGGVTDFSNSVFKAKNFNFTRTFFDNSDASFNNVQISGELVAFSESRFKSKRVGFVKSKFVSESTNFRQVKFESEKVNFNGSKFLGHRVIFKNSVFCGQAFFEACNFANMFSFQSSNFNEKAFFKNSSFSDNALHTHAAFRGTTFMEQADFRDLDFIPYNAFDGTEFQKRVILPDAGDKIEYKRFLRALKSVEVLNKTEQLERKSNSPQERRFGALERGCMTLKQAMEKMSDKNRAFRYFKFEMLARQKRPSVGNLTKIVSKLYSIVADYGASIWRPTAFYIGSMVFFAIIYLTNSIFIETNELSLLKNAISSLDFSASNVFRPLTIWSERLTSEPTSWSHSYRKSLSHGGWVTIKFIATMQSFFSLTCLFLIALAIKRKFQIS